MIYATQNQNIFENFCSRPVWTIRKFYLSFAKHLTMKQITDKSIYLWVLKWLPVIGTALIALHYAMLPFGYNRSGHRCACTSPINYMISYGKESKTSTAETAGDDAWQIQASAEIRRVPELLGRCGD